MKPFLLTCLCGTLGTLLVSCLTVNINFPTAEIEQSAERIIDEVRPEGVELEGPLSSESETDGSSDERENAATDTTEARRIAASTRAGVFVSLEAVSIPAVSIPAVSIPEGHWRDGRLASTKERTPTKEAEKDEILDDPRVKKIIQTLKKRYPRLLTFYQRGALGENRKAYVDTRDVTGLTLKEKNTLRKLRAAENKDRKNLYKRIAILKGVEEDRLKDIEAIYAEKWISKAKKGWWVQNKQGKWIKKAKDPKKIGTESSV